MPHWLATDTDHLKEPMELSLAAAHSSFIAQRVVHRTALPLPVCIPLPRCSILPFLMTSSILLVVAVVLSSFTASLNAYNVGRPALQSFKARSTYIGGWALAQSGSGSTCPSNISVACNPSNSAYNLACCPNGQTAFTDPNGGQYCCPSSKSAKPVPSFFATHEN